MTGVDLIRQGLGVARKRPGSVALAFLHPLAPDLRFTENRHEIPAFLPTEPSGGSLALLPQGLFLSHLFVNSFNVSGHSFWAQPWVLGTEQ